MSVMFPASGISYQYSEIFEILSKKHKISKSKAVPFRGRLQHFQRLGFPLGVNTGSGKRVKYTWRELFLMGLALEYVEIGSTPERIVKEILKFEEILLGALAKIASPQGFETEGCYLLTELSGLLALKQENQWGEEIVLLTQSEMTRVFSGDGDDRYRSPYAIIDLRQFVASILLVVFETVEIPKDQLLEDLKRWASKSTTDAVLLSD
ncbi:MAG: hypothetical protein Pars2KO_00190 [Parasphingorhabdus sp.]